MAALRDATEQGVFDDALRGAKTLVVEFYTPSCVLCRKLEPMLAAIGERLGDGVEVVKVNAETNLTLAAHYDVRGVPALMLIQQGAVRDRKSGFMTTTMLRDWIEPFIV